MVFLYLFTAVGTLCVSFATNTTNLPHFAFYNGYQWETLVLKKFLEIANTSSQKPVHMQTSMQILTPSTSAKPAMTKLQNLLVALVNMDIF